MAKIRVYELAKNLNMTNKMFLSKIRAMNIEVGSHMSSLDDETVALIKNNLFGKKESDHDDKRVKKTVIRRRKKARTDGSVESGEDTDPEETGASGTAGEEIPQALEEPVGEMAATPETKASETKRDEEELASASVETETQPLAEPETEDLEEEKKDQSPRVKKGKKTKKFEAAKIISLPLEDQAEDEEEAFEEPDTTEPDTTEPDTTEPVVSDASPEELNKEDLTVEDKTVTASHEIEAEPVKAEIAVKEVGRETAADKKEDKPVKIEDKKDEPKKKKKKTKKFTAAKIIKLPDANFNPETLKSRVVETKPFKKSKPSTPAAPVERQVSPAPESHAPQPESKSPRKQRKGKSVEVVATEDRLLGKKKAKRKTVVEGMQLYGEGRGRKGRKGGKGQKIKAPQGQKTQITTPKAIKRRIKIDDTIVLAELAKRMGIKANDMIIKLLNMGVMATVNQTIDYDTAALVAAEFGFEVEKAAFEEDIILNLVDTEVDASKLVGRPPVVTIMGHVDHGKTSLLDVIRRSSITTGEAGGITQHIGAYNVTTEGGQIVFLDTPGHEAFTAMRARGAQVTDIVILVVAADDGVMPQTIEALNHAKAAEVPIIVAVNKIDKEDADPDRVKRELSDYGIVAEDWGGDAMFVNVSAKQQLGINELLEMVLLQAEVLELKANPDRFALGHVVEAKLDSGRGPLATVLVQGGTLKKGQSVVCGIHYGKIRAMFDDTGKKVIEAGPSIPVEIIGLTGVPEAGDEFVAVAEDKDAKQVSAHRIQKARAKELAKTSRMSLEGLFEQIEDGKVKDLNMIIKADVHGSIEALKESLGKLSTSEVKINVIHSATGTVTESDVSLAAVSNAIILGFNVRPATKVQEMAKEENVDMRFYDIIYNAIKDIKDAMVGLMESTFLEKIIGRAEVRDTFVIPKKGTIAGAFVLEGKIQRGQKVRLLRDGVIIYDGSIASLKRFKDDAKEVTHGYECGIGIENFNDIKLGDTIDCYIIEEIKPTLE